MDYALLEGLGAGLQQVGGSVFKAKFLDKLKEEEEIRKEQRRQEREAAKVAETRVEQGAEGEFWRQDYNAEGKPINERKLADKTTIDKINQAAAQEKLNTQKQGLEVLLGEKKLALTDRELEDYDEMKALKVQGLEAEIGRKKAMGDAALIRATRPASSGGRSSSKDEGPEPTERDYAQLLKKEAAPIFAEFKNIPASTKDKIAMDAVRAAARNGSDPIDELKTRLRLTAAKLPPVDEK